MTGSLASGQRTPSSDEAALWARLMALAFDEARGALAAAEVPVGAVVWLDGEVVGRGRNRTVADTDPTAHAEVMALRDAARRVGNHRLTGSVVVATLEPCLLCCGALIQARVAGLVHAADDPKAGGLDALRGVMEAGRVNHRLWLARGPGAEESADLLRGFFRARR